MQLLTANEIAPYAQALTAAHLSNVDSKYLVNAACATALRDYLALTAGLAGQQLNDEDRIYNRYVWFARFKLQAAQQYGPDPGIDQQAYQIIEQANCQLDWNTVAQLDSVAAQPGLCGGEQ